MKYIVMVLLLLIISLNAQAKSLMVQLSADNNGVWVITHTQVIERDLPQTSTRPPAVGNILYQFNDHGGTVLVEGILSDPFASAAEFHRHGHMEGDLITRDNGYVVIRIPYVADISELRIYTFKPKDGRVVQSVTYATGATSMSAEELGLETHWVTTLPIQY